MKDKIEAAIRKLFPNAEIEYVDDLHADWKVGDRDYHLTPWYLSASEGNEDWGVPGETAEEVLECAALEDWADHGVMLDGTSMNLSEAVEKLIYEAFSEEEDA